MSIFSSIKDAIFGHKDDAPVATPGMPRTPSSTPPVTSAAPAGIPASPANAKWERTDPVDVQAILNARAATTAQKLNWNSSIVDLMKLLGIDSSLANRKELALELGYTGDMSDSAAMNIWLHKRVMQELQRNGGKVPTSLTV
jgi:hypothetical protein